MKESNEPECKKFPHQKVKKKPKGTKTDRSGTLLKGVKYKIERPFPHTKAFADHKYSAVLTSETRHMTFAFEGDPTLKEMRDLWKAQLAKQGNPSN